MAKIDLYHGTTPPPGMDEYEPWYDERTGLCMVGDKRVSGHSNPNLLINPGLNVNQQGKSSYTGTGYTVDRWRLGGVNSSMSVQENGIQMTLSAGYGSFAQAIENGQSLHGRKLTATVEVEQCSGGNVYLYINDGTAQGGVSITGPGTYSVTYMVSNAATAVAARLQNNHATEAASIKVARVKLELGPVSTLALDGPADYGTELAKCQRYYAKYESVLLFGWGAGATSVYLCNPNPSPMRIAPTITGSLNYMIVDGTITNNPAVGSWSKNGGMPGFLRLEGVSVPGLSVDKPCYAYGTVAFSAEL